jgi:hypothetical protein
LNGHNFISTGHNDKGFWMKEKSASAVKIQGLLLLSGQGRRNSFPILPVKAIVEYSLIQDIISMAQRLERKNVEIACMLARNASQTQH